MKRFLVCLCVLALFSASVISQPPSGTPQTLTTTAQDSIEAKAKADSALAVSQYRVIKKDLVVSDQVMIGTTIMVFIIVVMSLSKNFNPS